MSARSKIAAAVAFLTATAVWVPAHAQIIGPAQTIQMSGSSFVPKRAKIDSGDTVRWRANGGPHDIISDGYIPPTQDGKPDRDNKSNTSQFPPSDVMYSGATHDITFSDKPAGVYPYYCSIHGGSGGLGMSGEIYIGIEIPPPPPVPTPEPPFDVELTGGTAASPVSLTAALAEAEQRTKPTRLTLNGGYFSVTAATPNAIALQIQGGSPRPTIVNTSFSQPAFTVRRPGFRIRKLDMLSNATAVDMVAVSDVEVDDVSVAKRSPAGTPNTAFSVRLGANLSAVRNSNVTGFPTAVKVSDCTACDVLVDNLTVTGARDAVVANNAGSVSVIRSHISASNIGVLAHNPVIPTTPTEPGQLLDKSEHALTSPGIAVMNSTITGTSKAGVLIRGGSFHRIVNNDISSPSGYGVGIVASPFPTLSTTVQGNTVDATIDYGWDGIGVNVCFSTDDPSPVTEPSTLLTTNSCGSNLPVGVPSLDTFLALSGLI